MPKSLERKFEREYIKKGYTKKQADLIFFKWENKRKKMNKKAQGSLLFAFLVAAMLFIAGMIVVNFIKTSVTDARTDNTCSNPSSDGTKALCLLFDGVVPYFFVLVISITGGIITEKLLI